MVIASVLVLFVRHTARYFFLFDDFALVSQSSANGIGAIFTSPLFGFYRPIPFLVIRAISAVAGTVTAWPFAAFALLLHSINSCLVYSLGLRLRLSRESAAVAALLFLLSASAAESMFWLSGVFDRMAVCGMLAALLCGIAFCDAATARRSTALLAGGLLFSGIALFSKETGVVVPLLFTTTVALRSTRVRPSRVVAYGLMLALTVLAFMLIRSRMLPGLAGAYGEWTTLMSAGGFGSRFISYVLATAVVPLPRSDGWGPLIGAAAAAPILLSACWVLLGVQAVRVNLRWTLLCVASWVACVLPVLWAPPLAGSSAGGRMLYMPGIWTCLLVAAALENRGRLFAQRSLVPWLVSCAALTLIVALQLASVTFQAQLWTKASSLSRSAIEQIRPLAGDSIKLYIPNLPFWYEEGPYVLKDYAFSSFFGADFKPTIRARPMRLAYHGGETWFAGWVPEYTTGPSSATDDERTFRLRLPVRMPLPAPNAEIVSPPDGATLRQPFLAAGWAVDLGAPVGCGVDAVHVYAHPMQGAPIFLGAGMYGSPDENARTRFGKRFRPCGWTLRVTGLAPGTYGVVAHPRSTVADTFTAASVVRVAVR